MSFLSWLVSSNNITEEDSEMLEKTDLVETCSPLKSEVEEHHSDEEQSVTESNVSHMEQHETPVLLHGENIYDMSYNALRSHLKEMGINAAGKKHILLKKLRAVVESGDAERLEYRHKLRTPDKVKSTTKSRRSTRSRRSVHTPAFSSATPTKSHRQRKSEATIADATPTESRREEENETPYFSSEEMEEEEEATQVKAKPLTAPLRTTITPISTFDEPKSSSVASATSSSKETSAVASNMECLETASTAATIGSLDVEADRAESPVPTPPGEALEISVTKEPERDVVVIDSASSATSSTQHQPNNNAITPAPAPRDAIGILGDRFISVLRGDGPKLSEDEYAFFRRLLESGRPASAPIALQPVSPRMPETTPFPAPAPPAATPERAMPPPSVVPAPAVEKATPATKKRDATALERSPTNDDAYIPAAKRQTTASRWSSVSNESRMSMGSNYSIDSWHQLRPDGRPSTISHEERRIPFTPTRAVSATPGYTPKPMYTPQFKPSTARFSSGALLPLRSISSEVNDTEGSKWNTPMSSIQRRRVQRASMSTGATVRPSATSAVTAKRILDTLGELTSSLDEQRQKPKTANLALMKPIEPAAAQIEKPTTSKEMIPAVSVPAAPITPPAKPEVKTVSFAESTPAAKKSTFHAKPTPRPPRVVDSEFTFDSPKPIAGLDVEELEPEESNNKIKFTFSPACKSTTAEKRRKSLDAKKRLSLESVDSTASTTVASPVLEVKPTTPKQSSPSMASSLTPAAPPSSTTTEPEKKGFSESIWKRPNTVKCEVCLVQNDKSATKCVACESPLGTAPSTAPPVSAPPKLPSWAAGVTSSASSASTTTTPLASSSGFAFGASASATPASTTSTTGFSFGTTTNSTPAPSAGGFTFGAAPSTAPTSMAPATTTSTTATPSGFSFGASTTTAKSESSDASKPAVSFSFGSSSTATSSTTPTTTASVPSFSFSSTSTTETGGDVSKAKTSPTISFGSAETSKDKDATSTPVSTPSLGFDSAPKSLAADVKPATTTTPSFSFGAAASVPSAVPAASTSTTTSFTFGATSSAPATSVPATATSTTPSFSFVTPSSASAPVSTTTSIPAPASDVFGSASTTTATKPPLAQPSGGFTFGSSSAPAASDKPPADTGFKGFSFGASTSSATSVPVPPLVSGEENKKKRSSEEDSLPAEKRGVSFSASSNPFGGTPSATPAASSSGFQFGKAPETPSVSVSSTPSFGASTSSGTAPFNFLPKKEAKEAKTEEAPKMQPFGSVPSSAASSSSGFTFGSSAQVASATSTTPSSSFSFGSSTTTASSTPATKPIFGAVGGAGGSSSSGFSFSAASPASTSVPTMSFQFNKTTPAAPATPAPASSFAFGASTSIGNESPSSTMDTGDNSNMSVVNVPASSQGPSFGFPAPPSSSGGGMFGGIASTSAPFGSSAPSFGGSSFGSSSSMPFGGVSSTPAAPSGPFGSSTFNAPSATSFNPMGSNLGGGMSGGAPGGFGGGDSSVGFNLGAGDSNKGTGARRKVKAKRPQ